MDEKKKIGFVMSHAIPSNLSNYEDILTYVNYETQYCNCLMDTNYTPHLYYPYFYLYMQTKKHKFGFDVTFIPWGFGQTDRLVSVLKFLAKAKVDGISIIHIHGYGMVSDFMGILGRFLGIRTILQHHKATYRNIRGLEYLRFRIACLFYNKIITVNPFEQEVLIKICKVPPAKTGFVHHMIDPCFKPLNKATCRKRVGAKSKKMVLFAGRLFPEKGLDLVEELILESAKKKDIGFIVAGEGPMRKELGERINKLKLNKKVKFVGWVTTSDLVYYFNAADVLILPSKSEAFGLVCVESIACNTPVVAFENEGTLTSVGADKKVGLLAKDKNEFKQHFMRIISGDFNFDKKKAERIRGMYSEETLRKDLVTVYRKVLP